MFCPMKFNNNTVSPEEVFTDDKWDDDNHRIVSKKGSQCEQEECAWWVHDEAGGCAIKRIGTGNKGGE